MKFDMEDEVELLGPSKKMEESEDDEMDISQAIKVLTEASQKEGISIEDLIEKHSEASEDSEEEAQVQEQPEDEKEEYQMPQGKEAKDSKDKKLASYIALMKNKAK